MFRLHRSMLVLALLILLIVHPVPPPSLANGPEIGWDAGAIFPLATSTVQLVAEGVAVHLDVERPFTTCMYRLRNLSEAPASFDMAFVMNPPMNGRDYAAFYREAEFRVESEAGAMPVHYAPIDAARWADLRIGNPDALPTWRVTTPAGGEFTLRMSYRAEWSGGSDGESGGSDFTYHALPASLWSGVIEQARIDFHLGRETIEAIAAARDATDGHYAEIEPGGFVLDSTGIHWRFEEWEPSENFRVSYGYRPPAPDEPAGPQRPARPGRGGTRYEADTGG